MFQQIATIELVNKEAGKEEDLEIKWGATEQNKQ